MNHEPVSFEKSFERLEQILEMMNGGKTSLEESLILFEEAEKLIHTCMGRLSQAEQKVEMLIKGRKGEILLDANQKPKTESYPQGLAPQRPATAPVVPAPVRPTGAASHYSMDEFPF